MASLLRLLSLMLFGCAGASQATDNYQDWWWNPAQDGMAMNIAQQGETVAVAWYHYDSQTNPAYLLLAGALVDGTVSGDLVRANGPLPGSAYDPASVTRTPVGTASMTFSSDRQAAFTYDYDGRSGTIALERFTIAEESLAGDWTFASTGSNSGCMASTSNKAFNNSGALAVSHSGTTLTLALRNTAGTTCTHQITATQTGSFYRSEGSFTCSSGTSGSVELEKLRAIEGFIVGSYRATTTSGETCTETATFSSVPATTSTTAPTVTNTTGFSKKVEVFGLSVFATASISDAKALHAAKVLAGYLDNDGDGVPDNDLVMSALRSRGAFMFMLANEAEQTSVTFDNALNGQNLFAFETRPEGSGSDGFDATLEEVLHLVSHVGYANAYPTVFGESANASSLTSAMDVARGGQFTSIPSAYPSSAWYTYDDSSCDYSCMATEYFYWTLTSMLGAQDYTGRAAEVADEYQLTTRALVESRDPTALTLFSDTQYKLPTRIPDGNYSAISLAITTP